VFPAMFAEGGATRQLTDVNAEYRSSALSLNKEEARNNRQVKWGSCIPQIQPLVRTSWYRGFVFYSTLGHVGGGNSCGGCTLMKVVTTHAG